MIKCYVLTMSNKRRWIFRSIGALMNCDEGIIRSMSTIKQRLDTQTAEGGVVQRMLSMKFDKDEITELVEPPTVVKWLFVESINKVSVTWSNDYMRLIEVGEFENLTDLKFLESMDSVGATNVNRTLTLENFEAMVRNRIGILRVMLPIEVDISSSEDEEEGMMVGGGEGIEAEGHLSEAITDDED
jgi:hypothetical protein